MKKLKRSTLRMIISKRSDLKNLTDLRTIIGMRKLGHTRVRGNRSSMKRILNSNLSWQKRVEWIDRINTYTGQKFPSLPYMLVLYNDVEFAHSEYSKHVSKFSGKNNPAYQHGGKLSPYSKKSHFYDENLASKIHEKMREENNYNTRIEYYLKRGLSEEEAKEALQERQAVGKLSNFVKRYGVELGTQKWNERQGKWLKSCKRTNFSKISQELFDEVSQRIGDKHNIYYATYDREDMKNNINKEYTLRLSSSYIKPDFICLERCKIIEFDGDYWHNKNTANVIREKNRDILIEQAGYEVLHVKEFDYKKDKQGTIETCIKFLTQ